MRCFNQTCPAKAPTHTLFRVNAKGRPGIWACKQHRLEKDSELDSIVKALETKRCLPCNQTGLAHCSDPENCGGPWDKHDD